jgi:ParB-like chromosome segregation protein Spo0J
MQFLPALRGDHPLSFEMLSLASIKGNPNNAREHNRNQQTKLERSIEKFGFNIPVVVDENGELLCGHARVCAARTLGFKNVPAIRVAHLSESQKRA